MLSIRTMLFLPETSIPQDTEPSYLQTTETNLFGDAFQEMSETRNYSDNDSKAVGEKGKYWDTGDRRKVPIWFIFSRID